MAQGLARPAARPPRPRKDAPAGKRGKSPGRAATSARPRKAKPATSLLQVLAYRTLGRHLERDDPKLKEALERAALPFTPGMWRGLQLGAGLATFVLLSLLAGLGFDVLIGPEGAAYGVLVGAAAGLATWGVFPLTLKSRVQNRAHAVDAELPFALSELSVLAGIGLSPITLIRRMSSRAHDPATTGEFRRIVAMVDTEGRDLVSAMTEVARASPSEALRSTLWDMANLMHQGGDLETYLKGQSDTVLEGVRANQKSFTDQLGTYSDMYITLVLMGTMFVAVGAFMIDAFRTTAGPLTASGLLQLLTYGFVPVIVLVMGLLLSAAHGKVRS